MPITRKYPQPTPKTTALARRVIKAFREARCYNQRDTDVVVYLPEGLFHELAEEIQQAIGWIDLADRNHPRRRNFLSHGMRWEPCDVEHPVAICEHDHPHAHGLPPLWIRTFPPEKT